MWARGNGTGCIVFAGTLVNSPQKVIQDIRVRLVISFYNQKVS